MNKTRAIIFVGSLLRLKDLIPTDGIFHASFASSVNAHWSSGAAAGVLNGGALITSGNLDLRGNGRYGSWGGGANVPVQTGTIRFGVIPNYSGIPGTSQYFFSSGVAASGVNLIEIRHLSASAVLSLIVKNSAGVDIINYPAPAWVPVAGTEYEFELDLDVTTGATRLFINGALHGVVQTATGTRSGTSDTIKVGARHDGFGSNQNLQVSYLTVYNAVKHAAAYSAPSTAESATRYSTANPSVLVTGSIEIDGLDNFDASISEPAGSAVKFNLKLTATPKYWNGAAWATADDSYTQSNTKAEIAANCDDLDASAGYDYRVRIFLHSDDGSVRPTVTSVTSTYNYFESEPDDADECLVTHWVENLSNLLPDPTAARLIAESVDVQAGDNFIVGETREANFNSSGYAEVLLYETESSDSYWQFRIEYLDMHGRIRKIDLGRKVVPNAASGSLRDLESA